MDKRHLAFWAICVAILLVWYIAFRPTPPEPKSKDATPAEQTEPSGQDKKPADTETGEQTEQPDSTTGETGTSETVEPTDGTEPGETAETGETTEPAPFEEKTFELANPFATFLVSTKGGVVRQVTIETKKTSPDQGIVIHGDTKYPFCKETDGKEEPLPSRVFPLAITGAKGSKLDLADAEFKNITPEGAERQLVLRYENEAFSVTKDFELPKEGYRLSVKLTFEAKDAKVDLPPYDIVVGTVTPIDEKRGKSETVITVNTGSIHKLKVATEKKRMLDESTSVLRWAAVSNKYFTAVLDARGPKQEGEVQARKLTSEWHFFDRYVDEKKKRKMSDESLTVTMPEQTLLPGAEAKQMLELTLYIGPKEYARLRELGYSKVMGTKFIASIAMALVQVLNFIYGFIPNYGVVIIVLTALIKTLMFPLDRRSFKSMKEMQRIQPLLKQLQEKFKNDRQQLQIEQMKLFREHKVNPLGGCLPLLLQFPVLWAMFTMLRGAVELWRAPFLGYISDLSEPDTLFRIGSFEVHILPILMVVFTILSQRIRGASQTVDPQQKMMSQMMPILFLFIFYTFPSGLNLYWLCSTVFSFGVQVLVQKGDGKPQLQAQEVRITHERARKR